LKILIKNNSDTITYHINFIFNSSLSIIKYPAIKNYIFPCPASEYFSLSNGINEISSALLLNISGQVVLNFSKKSILENDFQLPFLENGIYFVNIIQRNKSKYFKLEINNNR